MNLPEPSIRKPGTILMLTLSIAMRDVAATDRRPVGVLPEVHQPQLFVQVPYPNSTPEQVERSIVRPLEEALGGVKGLRSMWSMCDENGGMVRLEFDWSMNMNLVRVE